MAVDTVGEFPDLAIFTPQDGLTHFANSVFLAGPASRRVWLEGNVVD
jgi:hypothetical protein